MAEDVQLFGYFPAPQANQPKVGGGLLAVLSIIRWYRAGKIRLD
jgi:hypothetical protein